MADLSNQMESGDADASSWRTAETDRMTGHVLFHSRESGVSDGQMNHLFQYADGFRIRKQQSFLESGVSDGQITNCSNPIGMSTPMENKRFPIP